MAEVTKKLVDGAGLQTAIGIMANYSDNMDRGVVGGYNQSFPLTAATKGNIYYHKGTNRYYICLDNYNGSSLTNPNSNFIELSVYTNRQRLDNLSETKQQTVEFYNSKVKAYFIKKGNIIFFHFDTYDKIIYKGDYIVIPELFRPIKVTDFIIVAHRAGDAYQGGNIRVNGEQIDVVKDISNGYLLQTSWIAIK